MGCRGCINLQCNCFTTSSETVDATGNGSQYAPFTFRPNNIPFPRPFGHLIGEQPQSLDGARYTLFSAVTPDIDQGGNMRTGDGATLTARADGLHLIGIQVPVTGTNIDLIDQISIRRNSIQVSSVSFAGNTAVTNGQLLFFSTTTLLDLNTGDTLDLFVERVSGAGSVAVTNSGSSPGYVPRIWAIWMGGPI